MRKKEFRMKKGTEHAEPVISMRNIEKEFSGVKALDGITFDVYAGEIHCLVGENGAGKSTLMNERRIPSVCGTGFVCRGSNL